MVEHTVAIGPYAAHILGIFFDWAGVACSILALGVGYIVGKGRGEAAALREMRRQEEMRRVRREVEATLRASVLYETGRARGLNLETPRQHDAHGDRAHDCHPDRYQRKH